MNLEEKKSHILRCIRLGMDLFSAALIAECTDEEVEKLEKDKKFMRRLKIENAIEEERLLNKHNVAIEEAVIRGNANSVQWKLERLNPGRWGSKGTNNIQPEIPVSVNLVGRFPDGKRC